MSRHVLQLREVDSQQLHRRRQALLRRGLEDDAVARLDGKPGVLRQLVLELSRGPACLAQRNQQALWALASADRLENVLRGGKADGIAHAQRRLPVAGRLVQY